MNNFDCVVVGSGHAGSCAALSAVEYGCKTVLVVDKCPAEWVGGNGYFTAGAHRTVHEGLTDLMPLLRNPPTPQEAERIDIGPYSRDDFKSDIMRLSGGKSDVALVDAVVDESRETMEWLAKKVGVPFCLSFNRQAYEVEGRQKFWGGMALSVVDGGKGLIAAHQEALAKAGVECWFEARAVSILMQGDVVRGIRIAKNGIDIEVKTSNVVLAAGGFEANAKLRAHHLGPGWERAKVRGTPYNTGDGFSLAKAVGAKLCGDWSGCHSTAWDANSASEAGQRDRTNQFTKSGYPLGIMVNARGRRFVDEGEDYRNYTYAKFGRAILSQPDSFVFQIWDSQTINKLRKEEYGDGVVEKIFANSVSELADKLTAKGLKDPEMLVSTVTEYNEAVWAHRKENPLVVWDPATKDGLSTGFGLSVPKTNWALALDKPPYMAVKVTCGITFTFGGLGIEPDSGRVISALTGKPMEGLYCTGEMVGGLFYDNYPGGSGLTAGAVFGRMAGKTAGRRVLAL